MKSEATPGREELIHAVSHKLSGHSFALITGGHHEEVASKLVDFISARLAAPSPDPDSINERRIAEDTRLASNVREATVEECAKIAVEYGVPNRFKVHDVWRDDLSPSEVYDTAATDVAGWIEKEIRALSTTGEPKR